MDLLLDIASWGLAWLLVASVVGVFIGKAIAFGSYEHLLDEWDDQDPEEWVA